MLAREIIELLKRYPDDQVVFALDQSGEEVVLEWDGVNESSGPNNDTVVVDLKARKPDREQEEKVEAFASLLEAAKTVLAHVEDDGIRRTQNQCTLCYSHRKLLRDAIRKAEVTNA